MGTNYYARLNPCHCCGRGSADIHIGRSYRTLRSYKQSDTTGTIASWADWRQWLTTREVVVVDEYGDVINLHDFIANWQPIEGMAERVAEDNARWWAQFLTNLGDYVDADGFRLSTREFS